MLTWQLSEVSSTENVAGDGPLAHRLDASAVEAPHRHQRRFFRLISAHARGYHLLAAVH